MTVKTKTDSAPKAKSPNKMEKLLAEYKTYNIPKVGDLIEGKIISLSKSEVHLDIEGLGTGVIRGNELIDESGEYSIANDYIDLGYDIGILINADNVILDGTGHMMDSSGAGYAIYVNNSRNITIKNFVLSNWSTGIKLEIAYNTSIENVDISNCTKGIDIYASYMIYVKDTGVMQNTYGIYTEIDCSALEITNCDIEKNIYGIYLSDAASSIIAFNMIGYNEEYGVYLLDDNGVHVYCNNIINNSYGIKQEFSRYNLSLIHI